MHYLRPRRAGRPFIHSGDLTLIQASRLYRHLKIRASSFEQTSWGKVEPGLWRAEKGHVTSEPPPLILCEERRTCARPKVGALAPLLCNKVQASDAEGAPF